MQTGLHHVHRRKKGEECCEKYPSNDRYRGLMDKFIYFVAIFGPLISIPQVWNIWVLNQVSGVSIITWSGYLLGGLFWLLYGFMHKEKPIIVTNILCVVIQALIIVGVVVYS